MDWMEDEDQISMDEELGWMGRFLNSALKALSKGDLFTLILMGGLFFLIIQLVVSKLIARHATRAIKEKVVNERPTSADELYATFGLGILGTYIGFTVINGAVLFRLLGLDF